GSRLLRHYRHLPCRKREVAERVRYRRSGRIQYTPAMRRRISEMPVCGQWTWLFLAAGSLFETRWPRTTQPLPGLGATTRLLHQPRARVHIRLDLRENALR